MAGGTNFNKELLNQAANDLISVKTISTASTSLKNKVTASTITDDIGGMDDTNGGWSWLDGQVSDCSSTVTQYIAQLQSAVESVHEAMTASIGTLTGADTDSTHAVNQSDNGTLGTG